uniref:Secreted protein n=1 Tax=Zea mays TaxID=4577 RepID=A0A804QIH7_MAIZE
MFLHLFGRFVIRFFFVGSVTTDLQTDKDSEAGSGAERTCSRWPRLRDSGRGVDGSNKFGPTIVCLAAWAPVSRFFVARWEGAGSSGHHGCRHGQREHLHNSPHLFDHRSRGTAASHHHHLRRTFHVVACRPLPTAFAGRRLVARATRQPSSRLVDWPVRALAMGSRRRPGPALAGSIGGSPGMVATWGTLGSPAPRRHGLRGTGQMTPN